LRSLTLLLFLILISLFQNGYASENLRIAHQKEFEPYSWVDSAGNAQGMFIDWWRIWSEKTNVELEFIPGNSEECINLVLKGEADVVAGLFFEQSHIQDLVYTGYIMRLKTLVALRKGIKPKSIHQVKEPLGILDHEISYQYFIEKYPGINLEKFDDFDDLREKVESKEIGGFIYEFPNPAIKNISISIPKGYYQYLVIREDKIRPAIKSGN
jgi:Bacterial extracellular solute-binding proteins, family 3